MHKIQGVGPGILALILISVIIVAAGVAVISINSKTSSTSSSTSSSTTSTTGISPTQNALSQGLGSFKNYSELQTFIAANAKSAQQYSRNGGGFGLPGLMIAGTITETMAATLNAAAPVAQSSPSYTGTNVQVAGVDEPDIVKTDGAHLFVSTTSAVTIINAYPPNSASVLSTLSFQNSNVIGMEIAQNRLLVINQRNTNTSYVDLLLYNTTNLSSPKLIENESIAGNYVASRLAGGYFYAIIQEPSYNFDNSGNATGVHPSGNLE